MFAVSIPAGFSDALRHSYLRSGIGEQYLFQSLLGFLMRCDPRDFWRMSFFIAVSIPAGFSDALRP